ncbi:MAG: type II toxin-antitoxin system RelE/ParE family toxin [Victivallaceae bacterium]|jgi:phage-related protein
MKDNEIILQVVFFKTLNGKEPVREWLLSLPEAQKKAIGTEIKVVQYGWPLGMPVVRKMTSDLWEVRINIPAGIARILFTVDEGLMVLLHGFIKKSQKTPENELKTAKKRLQQYRSE